MIERLVFHRNGDHPVTKAPVKDMNGNVLGGGSFYIKSDLNNHNPPFEKELVIRPLAVYSKYLHWDEKNRVYDCETVYFSTEFDAEQGIFVDTPEPIDNKGTLRCGRPSNLELNNFDDPDIRRAKLSKGRWYLSIFAQVYSANKVHPVTAEFLVGGKVGLDLGRYLRKIDKPLVNNQLRLFSVVNVDKTIHPKLELIGFKDYTTNPVAMKALSEVEAYVTAHNEKITEQHQEAVLAKNSGPQPIEKAKPKTTNKAMAKAIEEELSTPDTDEELPF